MNNENDSQISYAAAAAPETYSALRARLKADADNLEGQHTRTVRAFEILERHPEFEELIELLGLIRVPIKGLPFSSVRAAVLE